MQRSSLMIQDPDAGFAPILVSFVHETAGRQIPGRYRVKVKDADEGQFERNGLSALSFEASRHAAAVLLLSLSDPLPATSAKEAN